jgi:hypothetical protein
MCNCKWFLQQQLFIQPMTQQRLTGHGNFAVADIVTVSSNKVLKIKARGWFSALQFQRNGYK